MQAKNIKGAYSKVKLQGDSLQSHQEWTHYIEEGHFSMAASENKTILWSVGNIPQQKPEPYRNHSNIFLCQSIDWFLQNISLY